MHDVKVILDFEWFLSILTKSEILKITLKRYEAIKLQVDWVVIILLLIICRT